MNNYPKTYVARVLMPVVGNDGDVVMRPDYDKALLRITELETALEAAQKDAARYRQIPKTGWYVGPGDFYCDEAGGGYKTTVTTTAKLENLTLQSTQP